MFFMKLRGSLLLVYISEHLVSNTQKTNGFKLVLFREQLTHITDIGICIHKKVSKF